MWLIKWIWQTPQNVLTQVFFSFSFLQRPARIKSSAFDVLGSTMELGTILRIFFLEYKSLAVDLWFISLHRMSGTPQLVST